MSRLRPHFAVLLLASVAAAALCVGHGTAGLGGSSREGSGEAAFVVRVDQFDAAAARITNDLRRQVRDSERLGAPRLILLAVTALFVGLALRRRPTIEFAVLGRSQSSWCPQSGRAPPTFGF